MSTIFWRLTLSLFYLLAKRGCSILQVGQKIYYPVCEKHNWNYNIRNAPPTTVLSFFLTVNHSVRWRKLSESCIIMTMRMMAGRSFGISWGEKYNVYTENFAPQSTYCLTPRPSGSHHYFWERELTCYPSERAEKVCNIFSWDL